MMVGWSEVKVLLLVVGAMLLMGAFLRWARR